MFIYLKNFVFLLFFWAKLNEFDRKEGKENFQKKVRPRLSCESYRGASRAEK